jgi:hypothetical protein
MEITDTTLLSYLHDAVLTAIRYDASRRESRSVALEIQCHVDAGYEPWAGRRLNLLLEDIVMLRAVFCGFVVSKECLDGWYPRVSETMVAELKRLSDAGLDCSGNLFTLTFSTGSYLEGVCRGIIVESRE